MSSTFTGFSEEDLERIKSGGNSTNNGPQLDKTNFKKLDKIGLKSKRLPYQYKLPILQTQASDDPIDNIVFDKCKLSLRSPSVPPDEISNEEEHDSDDSGKLTNDDDKENVDSNDNITNMINSTHETDTANNKECNVEQATLECRKYSTDTGPDVVRGVDNYTEDELAAHRVKLEELQLKQKLMEEQNKKRKEMLAKALADRTKQTEEEVIRLEKIKKELQVLDGQFSQDVSVLRKKIDQACLSYTDAEKHYFKIEKEFLQAKINLQKEREKKELLTEHLCALITHNETRKAQKLETLMLELATDSKTTLNDDKRRANDIKTDTNFNKTNSSIDPSTTDDELPIIIDGVDQRSGKMVEFYPEQ
ncbi:golgin, RAB6 interacting [Aphomia sociella]